MVCSAGLLEVMSNWGFLGNGVGFVFQSDMSDLSRYSTIKAGWLMYDGRLFSRIIVQPKYMSVCPRFRPVNFSLSISFNRSIVLSVG